MAIGAPALAQVPERPLEFAKRPSPATAVAGITLAATAGGIAGAALVVITSGATVVAISTFAPNARGLAALAMVSALVGAPALVGFTTSSTALVLVGPQTSVAIGTAAAGAAIFGGMLGAGFGFVASNTLVPARDRTRGLTAAATIGGLAILGVVGASVGGGVSAAALELE